ncbi:MAG: hypothetical protein LCH30_10465 [Proteobacteria bacterium]|nr:hypothetical protein [Pseudomonadota bacterium]
MPGLLIKDATSDSSILATVFAHLARHKNMAVDMMGEGAVSGLSNRIYKSTEEAEAVALSFIQKLRDRAISLADSQEDKDYIKQFYKTIENMAVAKLNGKGAGINAIIKNEFQNFCDNCALKPDDDAGIEMAIQNREAKVFVENELGLEVQAKSKRNNKDIFKQIKEAFNHKTDKVIDHISSSLFLEQNGQKIQDQNRAMSLIKSGQAFTSTGQLKEGFSLDTRSIIRGMNFGKLTSLEEFLLNSAIITSTNDFAKSVRPDPDADYEDPTVIANVALGRLAQTHFAMMMGDKEKESLLREVRTLAKKIQKLDNDATLTSTHTPANAEDANAMSRATNSLASTVNHMAMSVITDLKKPPSTPTTPTSTWQIAAPSAFNKGGQVPTTTSSWKRALTEAKKLSNVESDETQIHSVSKK